MKNTIKAIFVPLMTLFTITVLLSMYNSVAEAATNFTQDSSCKLALKLDDTTGAVSSMCANNNGTATGATANLTGHFNKAFKFDGNDYIKGNSTLGLNGNSFTISFWANLDTQNLHNGDTFIGEPYDSGNPWDAPYVNMKISSATNAAAYVHYTTSNALYQAQSIDGFFQNGYHHYAFVKNNSLVKFYRDGVQVGSDVSVPSGNLSGSFKWFLGIRVDTDPAEFLTATMDEVGVFSRVLTTTEIVSIKDNGLDGQQTPPPPPPPPSCTTDYTLCTTQTACVNASFYWYNNQCNNVPQPPSGGNQTFYIRPAGGTSTQCNGLSNTDYPGSGTNQNCAFNHPNWALPMSGQPVTTLFQGGDTMIIAAGNYEFGVNAPNHPATASCHWSFPYACTGLGPLPSGTSTNPTKILGEGWDTGCSNPPQLWGSERVGFIVSLEGSNNVEMRCLDITDHSNCIENQGSDGCNKSAYPYGPWSSTGVVAKDSSNVLMEKVKIHGMASKGIHIGRVSNYELRDSVIRANGFVGWDGDLGGQNSSNSGYMKFIRTTVEYNGCAEDFPPSAQSGYVGISKCWSQGQSGYGDGIGTSVTDGNWYFEDANISHNVSDGVDLLYAGTLGSLTIKRGVFEGNAGNQVKSGFDTTIEDAKIIGNCAYFTAFGNTGLIWNGGTGGAQWDGNCRALGNTIAFDINKPGQRLDITSSTITGQGDVLLQSSGDVCNGAESITSRQNIWIGGKEYYHDGDTGFYYAAGATGNGDGPCGSVNINNQNSIVYKVKTSPCPQATIMCVDPLFVGVTITDQMIPANIHNYNVALSPLSPAIGIGNMISGLDSLDNMKFDRGLTWDFGAFEFSAILCGNGTLNTGEVCDDGANNGLPGYCNAQCSGQTSSGSTCGNGVVNSGEVCDGNSNSCTTAGGYAGTQSCNSTCTGFNACSSSGSCGDQIINGQEVCDLNTQTCVATGGYSGIMLCNTACSGYQACTSNLFCGDAMINGAEVCDGGSASCVTASGYAGSRNCNTSCSGYTTCTSALSCGDNIINGPEVCDGTTSCTTASGYPGVQNCNSTCSALSGSCSSNMYCGDNSVNGSETCDGNTTSCTTTAGYAGTKNCNISCSGFGSCSSTQTCGDSTVNGPEVCDGNSTSCTINGYLGTRTCNTSCSAFNSCVATQYCGDGAVNGNEQCDDNNTISGDGCSSSCQIENNNNPPTMTYVNNLYNIWLKWKGYDIQNGYNIQYSYKVDNSSWTAPTTATQKSVNQLRNQFNLGQGTHTIYVKAIDQNQAESQSMSRSFYVN